MTPDSPAGHRRTTSSQGAKGPDEPTGPEEAVGLTATGPGAAADTPADIPLAGWRQVLRRAWRESKTDQVPLMAAGVAFYSFLALFPAMVASVLLYGLLRDPQDVEAQVRDLTQALPADATSLLTDQLQAIAASRQQSLGLGLLVSLVLALWSASGGVGNIMTAINIAYDEEETRGFVKRKLLALGLTLGAIVFLVVALALVAAAPVVLDDLVGFGPLRWLLEALRWIGLVVAMTVALALLYRLAPDRDDPRLSWVSVGAATATVIWVLASLAFSVYVDSFGSYNKTYGTLAGVVVLLLWLWLTMFVVLLGAEVNAEAEQQTVKDTTVGRPRPLGQRHAVKADTLPDQETPEADPSAR